MKREVEYTVGTYIALLLDSKCMLALTSVFVLVFSTLNEYDQYCIQSVQPVEDFHTKINAKNVHCIFKGTMHMLSILSRLWVCNKLYV